MARDATDSNSTIARFLRERVHPITKRIGFKNCQQESRILGWRRYRCQPCLEIPNRSISRPQTIRLAAYPYWPLSCHAAKELESGLEGTVVWTKQSNEGVQVLLDTYDSTAHCLTLIDSLRRSWVRNVPISVSSGTPIESEVDVAPALNQL